MLYRKYRPQKFSEISGLLSVKKTLLSQVKDGKIVHAYLFAGPRGTGKTTTARILAKAINCLDSKKGEPCRKCRVCKQIEEGRYLDLIEIDAASNRGIDDIRSLREKVRLAPSVGSYKVYIVDEAHMLTKEAFNALLKTLEEPPKHAIFILCTTEPYRLLETIRSRCQRFNFERASVPLLVERLREISRKEKAKLGEEELTEIAKASSGGFRDAETLLEQVITGGQKVGDLVGIATLDNLEEFFDFLIAGETSPALVYINDLFDKGVRMDLLNEKILEYLRDLLLINVGVGESLVEVGKERFAKMVKQASLLSPKRLNFMISKFTHSQDNFVQSSIATLPLEVAVVEVTHWEEGEEEAPSSLPEKEEEKVEEKAPRKAVKAPVVSPDGRWQELMQRVKPLNHSIAALLRSCEPVGVKGKRFTIRAFYPFHKERLEEPRNRTILEGLVKEIYGKRITLKTELSDKKDSPKK
jgi:DNA polymerase-3 subunit gamma/tau